MSILTEEEILSMRKWTGEGAMMRFDKIEFGRAIESAVLEKLAGMELPEPFGLFCGVRHDPPKTKEFWGMLNEGADNGSKCNLYTAAQLHQAYAQGAASQLAQEPFAWISSESVYRLNNGGNHSKGTVPVHANRTSVSKLPLYTLKTIE